MFAHLPAGDPGDEAIEALVKQLEPVTFDGEPALMSEDQADIPAGYTYLGQFVDHDITFDATSTLHHANNPYALVDSRTPRLDLDSLYGLGPVVQPYLYDWHAHSHRGAKLLEGIGQPGKDVALCDLPRNVQGRALIGDPRNDENLIVSQLHLLFIRFHNTVVDRVGAENRRMSGIELFEQARRIVRWHYQWIVAHDFLPRVVGKTMAASVLRSGAGTEGPKVSRKFYRWRDDPLIPVEFSAAAFRFGHSMVRQDYGINGGMPSVRILPASGGSELLHLGGFRPLPRSLEIEWDRFFFRTETKRSNFAMRINQIISTPLFHIPPRGAALPRLNLERGQALGLPAGADVARAMGEPPLTEVELKLQSIAPDTARAALFSATPLWYYILREASLRAGGMHLGPVGGRIVAEVLAGLLEADPSCYLHRRPAWRPELPSARKGTFTMPDLLRFTL